MIYIFYGEPDLSLFFSLSLALSLLAFVARIWKLSYDIAERK